MKDVAGITLHLTLEGGRRMKHRGRWQYFNQILLVELNVECKLTHPSPAMSSDCHTLLGMCMQEKNVIKKFS